MSSAVASGREALGCLWLLPTTQVATVSSLMLLMGELVCPPRGHISCWDPHPHRFWTLLSGVLSPCLGTRLTNKWGVDFWFSLQMR